MRGIWLDLAADAGDAHVDGAVEGFAVARLREVEQALAREHALGVFRKRLQQRELGTDQWMLVAFLVAQHLRVHVEPFGAEADRRTTAGRRAHGHWRWHRHTPPQHRAHAREELA